MSKKVEVTYYISVSGHPDVSSNLVYEDIDMLQILLHELSNNIIIDKVLRLISEPYKVTGLLQEVELFPVEKDQNKYVLLSIPLFEDENGIPQLLVNISKLKKIIHDWKNFLKNKKEFSKIY